MTDPQRPDDRAEPERDAWLAEALRHAPDAQAAPPAAVRDAILRQARAATQPAPSSAGAVATAPLARLWDWLARPRVAAGFASVLVATLIGSIWWGQPIEPAGVPAPAPVTESAAPPAAAPPRATAPPPAAPRPPAVRRSAPETMAPAAPAPPPADVASAEARDDASAAAPGALARRSEASESRAAAKAADAAPARPAAWAALLASVAAEPKRWHWQRNGLAQPMAAPLQSWLTDVDAATAGRWQRTDEPAPAPAGRVLRLYRDGAGTPAATLRFDAERIWLTPETHAAALPAAALERLLQALDTATP